MCLSGGLYIIHESFSQFFTFFSSKPPSWASGSVTTHLVYVCSRVPVRRIRRGRRHPALLLTVCSWCCSPRPKTGPLRALKIRPQYFVNRKGRPGPWLETEEMYGLGSFQKLRPYGVPCISHAKMLCLFSCPILFL